MAKFLRIIGIVFMSLTAFFTLMGGIGTTCVALAAEKYDSMAAIAPYKWLYVLFVLATTAIGVMGVRAVILLIKRRANAYNYALLTLVLGTVVGAIHMLVSRSLRGSSMPVDAVVYTTVLTLIIFLIFRIPPVWAKMDFTNASKNEGTTSGGVASIVCGVMALTIQYWMASTHTIGGINYGDAFHTAMTLTGVGLLLLGISLLVLNLAVLPSRLQSRLVGR